MDGREEQALVVVEVGVGRGSWVGFLGEEEVPCRFLLGTEAAPFLGIVGVQAGEAAFERHI